MSQPKWYGPNDIAVESPNLSDDDLAELGYEELDYLTEVRAHARSFGGGVLVRSVLMHDGHGGYLYGVSFPRDLPFWRGTLEEAAEKVSELEERFE